MLCPFCKSDTTQVVDTDHDSRGGVRRRRKCVKCNQRFTTHERAVRTTPYVAKRDGRTEPFDREKLLRGIRVACAKRPVSESQIQRMLDGIEAQLQMRGKPDVPGRVIGDIVIAGLKELDHIAYIRYAIVYLGLDDLHAVRKEIDDLLAGEGTAAVRR